MYHFHTRGTRAGDLPRGWKIEQCSIFFAPHGKNAWGIPENDVTQMGFPVYRRVFCQICEDKPYLDRKSLINLQIWQKKPHL